MSELHSSVSTEPPSTAPEQASRSQWVSLSRGPAVGLALFTANLACTWFFRTAAVGAALALVNALLLIAVLLAIPRHRDLIVLTAGAFIGIGYGLKLFLLGG